MFRHLAEAAAVPVVAHLDHGYTVEDCREALDAGFTSVMFDGSRLPLAENIQKTAAIAEMAHAAGASCEGEIGFVGYSEGEASKGTDPEEATMFERDTGVDAMAVSVGNVHLQTEQSGGLDEARIFAIQSVTSGPLVIHGGSGVPGGPTPSSGPDDFRLQIQHRDRVASGLWQGTAGRGGRRSGAV